MRRCVSLLLLASAIVGAKAQSVTYNHDASVMNQFTIGEIGAVSYCLFCPRPLALIAM